MSDLRAAVRYYCNRQKPNIKNLNLIINQTNSFDSSQKMCQFPRIYHSSIDKALLTKLNLK